MARPVKWRKIENVPEVPFFVPSYQAVEGVEGNTLKLEELEAIRLKDYEGLEQIQCAERMEISRPTFQRILLSARAKIADSLIHGKVIRIEGGNFTMKICPLKCTECGKEWTESIEKLDAIKKGVYICPKCKSEKVCCVKDCQGKFCNKKCWRVMNQEEK